MHKERVRIPAYYAVLHRPGMRWAWSIYAANPHSIWGLNWYRGSRFLFTETVKIKQNRTENAKPSRFSRVFLEVPGGLPRDKGIHEALNCHLQALTSVGACFSCGGRLSGIFCGCRAAASKRPSCDCEATLRALRPPRSAVQQALIYQRNPWNLNGFRDFSFRKVWQSLANYN